VQEEEGARYAAGLPNAFYMETSAKAGTNVELLFNEVGACAAFFFVCV